MPVTAKTRLNQDRKPKVGKVTVGYRGILKRGRKYSATITVAGKYYFLGSYNELWQAVEKRNNFIRIHEIQEYYPIQEYMGDIF